MTAHDGESTGPMERIASALDAAASRGTDEKDIENGTGAALASDADGAATDRPTLVARDVGLSIGDQRVLDGVDLRIDDGEIVVLMGPNGAGKSMFLSACAGALAHDDGSIEYFDAYEPRAARGLFSVAIQGDVADPDLTGAENCEFFTQLHPAGTDDWRRLADRLELSADLDRTVADYSGGMARKVELASALSADVPCFLLDEPAAALDLSMLRVLHDELLSRRDDGASILLTSHTPLDAQIADRLVFLRDGRVFADGAPDALLDGLPPVLRVRGAVPDDDRFVGDRAFGRGDEVRGFLREEAAIEAIEAELPDDALVEIDPPSFTDLFNYYAYLAGEESTDVDGTSATGAAMAAATADPNDDVAGPAAPEQ
ncbi:ABC transporter ATP-binding protein [Salinarchaeum chitinilyticum]